jgi:hypothetical protein
VKSILTTIINGSIDIFGVYFTKLGKKKWLYYHKALLTNIMYVFEAKYPEQVQLVNSFTLTLPPSPWILIMYDIGLDT